MAANGSQFSWPSGREVLNEKDVWNKSGDVPMREGIRIENI